MRMQAYISPNLICLLVFAKITSLWDIVGFKKVQYYQELVVQTIQLSSC